MSYVIAGRAIKSEYLALGTLLGTAALAKFSMSGGSKEKPASSPSAATAASSSDFGSKEEEEFIRNFIAEAEKADKAEKH